MSTSIFSHQFQHFLRKAEDAAKGGYDAWAVQSTGERVSVALALNRADWLARIGYTLAEAIERSDWIPLVRDVERALRERGLL